MKKAICSIDVFASLQRNNTIERGSHRFFFVIGVQPRLPRGDRVRPGADRLRHVLRAQPPPCEVRGGQERLHPGKPDGPGPGRGDGHRQHHGIPAGRQGRGLLRGPVPGGEVGEKKIWKN